MGNRVATASQARGPSVRRAGQETRPLLTAGTAGNARWRIGSRARRMIAHRVSPQYHHTPHTFLAIPRRRFAASRDGGPQCRFVLDVPGNPAQRPSGIVADVRVLILQPQQLSATRNARIRVERS